MVKVKVKVVSTELLLIACRVNKQSCEHQRAEQQQFDPRRSDSDSIPSVDREVSSLWAPHIPPGRGLSLVHGFLGHPVMWVWHQPISIAQSTEKETAEMK